MPTFTSFSDLLPDPNNKINAAGASDAAGGAGPGFAKIKFASNNQVQVSRTVSGRGVATSPGSHNWAFDINYNPMTRDEFDPVSSFLEGRQGRFRPFFVILPQHSRPKDTAFNTYAGSNSITASLTVAGSPNIMINGCNATPVSGTAGTNGVYSGPQPGDFFTITDNSNVTHTKAYKVIRVEDHDTYQVGSVRPTTSQRRVWTQPPLARAVSSGATLNFINPRFRVIQKGDVVEYDLDTDNLYQFSLSLEEIQP
jgi:hypothetical protein